jgi:hypothetical protein
VGWLALVLLGLLSAPVAALDIDLQLIGYSFLPVASAQRDGDGIDLVLRDGSHRRISLTYGYLVGTNGDITRPLVLHQHWLRISHAGDRASLVTTSLPLVLLAAFCLMLDGVLLARLLKRRRNRRESGRDGLSPTPAARGNADSAPPTP